MYSHLFQRRRGRTFLKRRLRNLRLTLAFLMSRFDLLSRGSYAPLLGRHSIRKARTSRTHPAPRSCHLTHPAPPLHCTQRSATASALPTQTTFAIELSVEPFLNRCTATWRTNIPSTRLVGPIMLSARMKPAFRSIRGCQGHGDVAWHNHSDFMRSGTGPSQRIQ